MNNINGLVRIGLKIYAHMFHDAIIVHLPHDWICEFQLFCSFLFKAKFSISLQLTYHFWLLLFCRLLPQFLVLSRGFFNLLYGIYISKPFKVTIIDFSSIADRLSSMLIVACVIWLLGAHPSKHMQLSHILLSLAVYRLRTFHSIQQCRSYCSLCYAWHRIG